MLGGYRNPNDCACLKDLCLLALPRASKKREAQTRTIATSATSFSATVVISGASFMPMLAYPKMPLVLESRNFTSGKDARARSKTTLRTERRQWRSRQRGRADRPRKSGSQEPGCSKRKGRSCSVLVFICGSDSYSATCGATCGGSGLLFGNLVGVAGFEPATPSSRTRCATRLRYTPTVGGLITPAPLQVQA